MATAVVESRGADDASASLPAHPAPRVPLHRRITTWALVLVTAQLAVRARVMLSGGFFEDDIALAGLAASSPGVSADHLLQDYAGHLMPGVFLVAEFVTAWAPLEWWAPALTSVVLQALASLAVLRLLRTLLGDRPALLLPLTLYLFAPLSLPSFAWWASGLNALPLQIALAWAAADAVRLVRTGRRRYAVSGTLAVAFGLAFFLKALVVPWFAFAVVAVHLRLTAADTPLRSALRRGAALWWGSAAVTAVWAWAYTARVSPDVVAESVPAGDAAVSVLRGLTRGVLPALVGGPWQWARAGASTPWAESPVELAALAGLVVLVAVVVSCRRRRGAWIVWTLVAAHLAFSTALMVLGRFTPQLAGFLPLTLRHYTDVAVVGATAWALILRAPARPRPALLTPRGRRLLLPAAVALFVTSSLWSTLTFTRVWDDVPSEDYLATARASLAEAGYAPLLDQPVPDRVIWSAAFPHNLASSVFAPLSERPPIAGYTWDLRMIDDSGTVVPAHVVPSFPIEPGPISDCGYGVGGDDVTYVALDREAYAWEWTARVDYIASRDGELHVSLATGEGVRAPVRRGLNAVFVRLSGGGDELRLSTTTPDLALCVTGGAVGLVEPDAAP